MKVIATHIWLLITLRHCGTGLPRTLWPVLASIVAASVVAAMRWSALYDAFLFSYAIELLVIGLAMCFWLLLLAYFSPAFSAAFAFVSIGADLVTIVLAAFGIYSEYAKMAILFVESVAISRMAIVLYLNSRRPGRG